VGGINNVYNKLNQGTNPFFNSDYDLVEIARNLINLLPLAISREWVKGYYHGRSKESKHDLNHEADHPAMTFQQHQPPRFTTLLSPLPPPNSRVCLIHHGMVIMAKYATILWRAFHEAHLIKHIMAEAKFSSFYWDAHETPFC
jgi:hypothetical protein